MSFIGKLLPGIGHLHNLHPLTVHFPIAYVIGAVLLYGVAWRWPNDKLEWTAYWFLMLGFASCYIAAATGFYAFGEVPLSDTVRRHLLSPHMNWMLLALLLITGLAAWAIVDKPFPRAGRRIFMFLSLILLIIITYGADYGSRLVYDYNADGTVVRHPMPFSK